MDLNTIANLIDNIAKVEKGCFARMCVEIYLQKKVGTKDINATTLFNIEYEGLGLIYVAVMAVIKKYALGVVIKTKLHHRKIRWCLLLQR